MYLYVFDNCILKTGVILLKNNVTDQDSIGERNKQIVDHQK